MIWGYHYFWKHPCEEKSHVYNSFWNQQLDTVPILFEKNDIWKKWSFRKHPPRCCFEMVSRPRREQEVYANKSSHSKKINYKLGPAKRVFQVQFVSFREGIIIILIIISFQSWRIHGTCSLYLPTKKCTLKFNYNINVGKIYQKYGIPSWVFEALPLCFWLDKTSDSQQRRQNFHGTRFRKAAFHLFIGRLCPERSWRSCSYTSLSMQRRYFLDVVKFQRRGHWGNPMGGRPEKRGSKRVV